MLYRTWPDEGLVYIVFITDVKHAKCEKYIYIHVCVYMYTLTRTLDYD
jgi:hypothetical protein